RRKGDECPLAVRNPRRQLAKDAVVDKDGLQFIGVKRLLDLPEPVDDSIDYILIALQVDRQFGKGTPLNSGRPNLPFHARCEPTANQPEFSVDRPNVLVVGMLVTKSIKRLVKYLAFAQIVLD